MKTPGYASLPACGHGDGFFWFSNDLRQKSARWKRCVPRRFKRTYMNRQLTLALICLSFGATAFGQTIKVNPIGVNVNPSSATTVFLTYGRLVNYRPAEAYWCGDLIDAAPDLGLKCNPSTI